MNGDPSFDSLMKYVEGTSTSLQSFSILDSEEGYGFQGIHFSYGNFTIAFQPYCIEGQTKDDCKLLFMHILNSIRFTI